jgi:hypothetical protein
MNIRVIQTSASFLPSFSRTLFREVNRLSNKIIFRHCFQIEIRSIRWPSRYIFVYSPLILFCYVTLIIRRTAWTESVNKDTTNWEAKHSVTGWDITIRENLIPKLFREYIILVLWITRAITVAARSKAWTVFVHSNTGIVSPLEEWLLCAFILCLCCPVCR